MTTHRLTITEPIKPGDTVEFVGTQPPKPPPKSEWPKGSLSPDQYNNVEEVAEGNLKSAIERVGDRHTFFILHPGCAPELAEAMKLEPERLGSHAYTLHPNHWHQATLDINSPRNFKNCAIQGFRISGNIGARFTGGGNLYLYHTLIEDCWQGLTVTDGGTIAIYDRHNTYRRMRGVKSQCVYMGSGVFNTVGSTFEDVHGDEPHKNHAIYCDDDAHLFVNGIIVRDIDSHAIQARGGARVFNVLALHTANGILFGNEKKQAKDSHLQGYLNFYANDHTLRGQTVNLGVAINTQNVNITVKDSIVAHERSAADGSVIKAGHNSNIKLDNLYIHDYGRYFDVDGENVTIEGEGTCDAHPEIDYVTARRSPSGERYDKRGATMIVRHAPRTLPDLSSMKLPEPGTVAEFIKQVQEDCK